MADTKVFVLTDLPLRECSNLGCGWYGVILSRPANQLDHYLVFEPVNPPDPCGFCPKCGDPLKVRT
jgi:hypothetical protein